jgi:hypothetical protein
MADTTVTDSYVATVEAGDAYFATRLGATAWTGATSADKAKALQMATRALDSMQWDGVKYDSTQERAFPRKYRLDPDQTAPWGTTITLDAYGWYAPATPQAISDACCEEAIALLSYYANTTGTQREALIAAGVTQFKLGDLAESYSQQGRRDALKSPVAKRLVVGLMGFNARII